MVIRDKEQLKKRIEKWQYGLALKPLGRDWENQSPSQLLDMLSGSVFDCYKNYYCVFEVLVDTLGKKMLLVKTCGIKPGSGLSTLLKLQETIESHAQKRRCKSILQFSEYDERYNKWLTNRREYSACLYTKEVK